MVCHTPSTIGSKPHFLEGRHIVEWNLCLEAAPGRACGWGMAHSAVGERVSADARQRSHVEGWLLYNDKGTRVQRSHAGQVLCVVQGPAQAIIALKRVGASSRDAAGSRCSICSSGGPYVLEFRCSLSKWCTRCTRDATGHFVRSGQKRRNDSETGGGGDRDDDDGGAESDTHDDSDSSDSDSDGGSDRHAAGNRTPSSSSSCSPAAAAGGGGGSGGGSGRTWLGSPTRTTSDGRVIKRRRFTSSLRVYECDWRLVLRAQPFPLDQQAFEELQKSLRVAVMCGICGVACATPQALAAHEKAGCPPRELVCSLCRRASKTRQGLQQHQNVCPGRAPRWCVMVVEVCDVHTDHPRLLDKRDYSGTKKFAEVYHKALGAVWNASTRR